MSFANVFKEILLRPSAFFKRVSTEKDFFDAVVFALICSLIPGTILMRERITWGTLPFFFAVFLFVFIMRLFIDSAVLHGLFKLCGGEAIYQKSLQILSYSYAANLFVTLSILAIEFNIVSVDFSLIFILYGAYLITRGGQLIYNLNFEKSAFAALLWEFWYLVTSFVLVTFVETLYNASISL
jgi:hypothetical protein